LSREFESYNIGRNLFLSKFCLESGIDGSLETFFEEISRSLSHLGIHIESHDLADAENIDEFLFDKLSDKEVALLTLGVAVGMIQSVLLSLSSEDSSVSPSTQGKMIGTISMALQRVHMVLDELGILEIGEAFVENVQPQLCDFDKLRASRSCNRRSRPLKTGSECNSRICQATKTADGRTAGIVWFCGHQSLDAWPSS
jgi:hypothetical protein